MRNLHDRTAIVTGASGGIGLFIARELATAGMRVVLAARSQAALEAVQQELVSAGHQAIAVPTDVASPAQRERLVSHTLAEFGSIDLLVNNAGIETYCPFEQLPLDDIDRTIQINLTSAIALSRLVMPAMLQQKSGHIVNVSSTAGMHGPAFGAAYGASKAGLISLAQTLRAEYHGRGVSASVVCPGFTHDGGIFERMKAATGKSTPAFIGSTTAETVARKVVQAIQKDRPEVLINWPPLRPVYALARVWPRLGHWLIRKTSARFLKRIATTRPAATPPTEQNRHAA